jgi:succinyl-diaminopimelate desuccinylase
MIIDRRFLVEEELPDVKNEVTVILDRLKTSREGFKYEVRDMLEVIPSMTDIKSPVVQETANAIKDVLGKEPDFICSPGTYDQKHIDRIGKLKDCIAYGPGILELAHQPDEYVEVEDMVNSAKVMAQAAYNLLMK